MWEMKVAFRSAKEAFRTAIIAVRWATHQGHTIRSAAVAGVATPCATDIRQWLPLLVVLVFCSLSLAEPPKALPHTLPLVPGIRITRLPVDLPNINNVEYGPDGKLYTAGYDGRIHVLTDTDGDGIEDSAKVFWDKAGDLLTPVGMIPTPDGVYVAARGKIALLTDDDGDGQADTSHAVVSGWVKEENNSDTRNDAAGLAIDKDGNLYFSLGCMSYNKAWLLDDDGRSRYDMQSERGTILKVSPDRKHREIVATGMRFIVGMDFNQHGDLFATDQEGDTWFPGGNPRDELLHVIPGRHYGFPFRHPDHLPSVVDEPEVVAFSPQHQSTCGFRFNELRENRVPFGPSHWESNAIVTGFSRGKLWRAPLAKTRAGYVGKQIQFAAFESLPTDVAISPQGDLLLTCHSGHPDWGAGPAAKGHLYKITFDRTVPQPVAAWSASPLEVKVAFDQPLNPEDVRSTLEHTQPKIEIGKFVWEGDSDEWIWPGYEVVKAAKKAVRRPLMVSDTQLSADRRTLTLTTAPQPWRSRSKVILPRGIAGDATSEDSSDAPSAAAIELSYDLSGVRARWTGRGESKPSWIGWLPHLDTHVIRTMTAGSADHERLLTLLENPGQLNLRTQLVLPGKEVTLRFESSHAFRIRCRDLERTAILNGQRYVAEFTVSAHSPPVAETGEAKKLRGGRQQVLPTDEVSFELILQTGRSSEPGNRDYFLDASYHADFDPHERPLRLEHLVVPWAPSTEPPASRPPEGRSGEGRSGEGRSGEPVVGDPEKGREIFLGKEANCVACHSFGGQGGKVAADLTVSVHRDPDAVMRDIVQPSASINPDYVSYTVLTNDGRTLTGLFQSADEKQITLTDQKAVSHVIARDEIEDIRASSVSLMPSGFDQLGKRSCKTWLPFFAPKILPANDVNERESLIPNDLQGRWLALPDPLIALLP